MSIRNNTCFNVRMMSFVLVISMSNLAWANKTDSKNYFQSNSSDGTRFDYQRTHNRHNRDVVKNKGTVVKSGEFGLDLELSTFNELSDIVTNYNYAEVILEDSNSGNVYISQQTGNAGNKAKVVQSDSVRSNAGIWQKGSNNTALITQSGENNRAYIAQDGYGNKAWINQAGYNNEALIAQYGSGSSLSVNQKGNHNKAFIVDYGSSNYGISQNGGDSVVIIGGKGISVYVDQTR